MTRATQTHATKGPKRPTGVLRHPVACLWSAADVGRLRGAILAGIAYEESYLVTIDGPEHRQARAESRMKLRRWRDLDRQLRMAQGTPNPLPDYIVTVDFLCQLIARELKRVSNLGIRGHVLERIQRAAGEVSLAGVGPVRKERRRA